MPLYACRWPNGDFTIVWASDKIVACKLLDEWGGADPENLIVLKRGFGVDFGLSNDGKFVPHWGELVYEDIKAMYPVLWEAEYSDDKRTPEQLDAAIREAVRQERERVNFERRPAKTKKGVFIQQMMGMSATVADGFVADHEDT